MKKKIFYKIIAGICLVALCVTGPVSSSSVSTFGAASYQNKIDEAKKNKEKLEKEKKELEKKLAALKVEQSTLEKAVEQLDKEYAELYDKIENTDAEIAAAELALADIEAELLHMENVAADQYAAMKSRVKYLYENGEESMLSLFLGGASIERIFNEMEYRSQVTKYDKQLLVRYNENIAQILQAKELKYAQVEELEAMREYQRAELAGLEVLAAEKKNQMATLLAELGGDMEALLAYQSTITKVQSEIKELEILEQKRLEEEERKRKEAEEEARRLAELQASHDIKNMIWPLVGYKTITSRFGPRVAPIAGATTYHMGIDIGAPMGAEVHACLAGTVIDATYNSTSGYYVRIDHGNGVVTFYGHASKLLVKKGDQVKRDQVIMKVGSTGIATGPHVHFSLHINGVAVDPQLYLKYNR